MNRRHSQLFSVIVTTALMAFGLTTVFAADVVPSYEILSVDASNDCNNGIVWVDSFINHTGEGSVFGWIGRDGVGGEGSFGIADLSYLPAGSNLDQINIPGSFPENTIFYIALSTYEHANQEGDRTFFSKIYFNCTTGEQIGDVYNNANPDARLNIEVPVAGPVFVHPLDEVAIIAINPNPQVQRGLLLPAVQPQVRGQAGG